MHTWNYNHIISEWSDLLNCDIMGNCSIYNENDLLPALSASYRSAVLYMADIITIHATGISLIRCHR